MILIGLSHGKSTFRRLISYATVYALIVAPGSLIPAMSADNPAPPATAESRADAGNDGQSSFDAARNAKISDLPIVEQTVPTAREAMKNRPPRRRIPGQDAGQRLKPAGAISTDIDISGRWLKGYRPNTPKAWREFEAWKAEERRALGVVGAMIPSAPGDVQVAEGQTGTGISSAEEEIRHFVREGVLEAAVVDIGELPDVPESPKSKGSPSDYHHGSGLLLEDYIQAKENAALFTPETTSGQEAVESVIDAPTGPNVAFNSLLAPTPSSGLIQVPPDPILAAGPGHLIAIVNSKFRVYDKSGTALITETNLDGFFLTQPNCQGSFDVFVDYDEANDRFVMGSMTILPNNDSYLCIAATTTNDPTTTWNAYEYRADGIDTSVTIDFPHMAIGLDAVYIGANMFADTGGFSHARLYAVDKTDLYTGTALTVAEADIGITEFGPQPARIRGATSGGWPDPGTPQYIIARGTSGLTQGEMRIWRWVNPFTQAPELWDNLGTIFNGPPPLAAENGDTPGSSNLNDSGDGKWIDAEYRNGFLWGTRTVACQFGGGEAEACIDWARVDVTGASPVLVEQQNGGAYGSEDQFRYYPDGAPDKNNNYAIGYTRSGWADYAEIYVTGRLWGDTAGTLQAEVLQKAAVANYTDGFGCGGACDRWGDYTGMTIDPDGCTLWYLGQFALSTETGQWGTHIGSYQFSDCSVTSSLQLNKGTYSCNDSVSITVSDITPIDAATVAANTTITSGSDSESPAASAWIGSDCIGNLCNDWTTNLAVSGSAGSSGDGTLNTVNGATILSNYADPHPTHDPQSRQANASCETRFDDGGFLISGGCEDGAGTEAYRDYIDAGENIQYSFGLFNPPTGGSLNDVQATLSITGAAATAGLVTIHNPTVHIGSMEPESLSGATFTISVDPTADAPAYRLSLHDFNLSVTSAADGFTTPQVLTQQQYFQGDDNIVTENQCYNFESAQGWQRDVYDDTYFCGLQQGCTPEADIFSTGAQWTEGTGCLSETRTDVPPPFDCDTGGSNAWMTNNTSGTCNNFIQTATTYTDDVLFSPVISPANTGNAGNGQPWYFQWQYAEWFYSSDMEVAPSEPAMGWAHFWSSDYTGVSTPAVNETDTLYDLALGFIFYPNQTWDSATPWDPVTGAVNYDGAAFPSTITGEAASGLQWRWAIRVRDVDAFGQARPTTVAATTGVAYDNLNLVYDQYHAEEQVGVCSAGDAPGVVALDQFSYTECGSGTMGVSVTDTNAPGSSVTVTLTSRGTGDSETFTISGTAPYFETTFGYDTGGGAGVDDGMLYVTPQDTVDASYDDTVPVGTATAFASIDCSEQGITATVNLIQDDGNGDGDEYPDTNEVMELSVSLRNNGATDLSNVTAYLFSDDPQIDCITKDTASFGAIPADSAVSNDIVSDPFVFSVASTTACSDPDNPPRTNFKVLITADGIHGSSAPQTLSFVLDVDLGVADGGSDKAFGGYAAQASQAPALTSTIEMSTKGYPDTAADGGADAAVCGNAFYDDELGETSAWFGGGQAGNPDCIMAEYFEPGDFSILANYEISSICFGNDNDWGVPAGPNRWRIHPDNGGVPNDAITLAEGIQTTGDGTGQDEQLISPPVAMGAGEPFWVVVRGDASCCDGQDFNVDLDQTTSTGAHRYSNACDGIGGLILQAESEFVIHTTLAETAAFVCDTTVRPEPAVCGLVVDEAGNLSEFCGDGDMNVEPTEIWDVDITLQKQGAGDAVSTMADLEVNLGSAVGATISGNPGDYGTIPGNGGTATDTYRFTVDPGASCINDITFDVVNISDTSTTYPNENSALLVPVGATVTVETGQQQTSPAAATNNTGSAGFTPAFSLASAASASLSYTTFYPEAAEETATQDTDPLTINNGTSESTLSTTFTISELAAVTATVDWTSLTHAGNVDGCTTVFLRTPDNTTIDLKADGATPANPYDVVSIYQGVNGGPGKYSIGLVEDGGGSGCNQGPATLTGVTMAVAGASSTFTDNARVELYDGTTAHLLKDYGIADANPYDVTSIYNGAGPTGPWEIRVSENDGGGTAEVSSAALTVSAIGCDLGCTALPGPPPVGDGVSGAQMLAGKGIGVDDVDITFDVATCSSDHAVVLYGDMGNFSAYQGEATTGCDAGNTGTATFNQAGSYWFNIIWVDGGNAGGYPGDATAGPRPWSSTGLCSITSENQADDVCN